MAYNKLISKLSLSGLLMGVFSVPLAAGQPDPVVVDVYSGGPIITMNDKARSAEAVAVKDGRIVAVGGLNQVLKAAGPKVNRIHLEGKTLIPGFVDAHGHVFSVGVQAIAANLLPPPDGGVDSIKALQNTLGNWMKTSVVPRKLGIVVGFGYDDSQLKEKRHPTKAELDAVSKEVPVILIHQSGHIQAYNSKTLELAGVTAATPDPAGGRFRRVAGSQEPDGVAEENAAFEVMSKVLPKLDKDDMAALIEAGQGLYARFGHTTAQEGAATPGVVAAFRQAAGNGKLNMDVVAYPLIQTLTDDSLMQGVADGKTYSNHFRIGGVKLVLDGSPQGKTAWLTKPYLVPPEGQGANYSGYPAMSDEAAIAAVTRAFSHNWQVLAHTNGDAAIDQYLKAVREASAKVPGKDRRPVMIHGQTLRADQIPALKELGVFPSVFPMHTYYWGDWHRDSVLGAERANNISPTGWLLKAGFRFSSHHDAPVAFPDTLRVLSATVNRTTRSGQVLGPDQRVEPWVALKAMTVWPAFQYFEENSKGTIEVGKLADFAVLSDNPLTIKRDQLATIQVLKTIKEGKVIYAASDVDSHHHGKAVQRGRTGLACADSARCFDRLALFRMEHPVYPEAIVSHRHHDDEH